VKLVLAPHLYILCDSYVSACIDGLLERVFREIYIFGRKIRGRQSATIVSLDIYRGYPFVTSTFTFILAFTNAI